MTFVRACLLVVVVGCGSGGGFPDAQPIDAPTPGGTFSLDWSLTNTNSQPITCDDIGGLSVTALLRNRAVQGGSTEVFTCGTLMGTSQELVPGIYDIDFELNGVSGLIATAPKQMGIVVTSGGNVQLAPLTFAVDATGGMKLNFATDATGGNCAATASNGARDHADDDHAHQAVDGRMRPGDVRHRGGCDQPGELVHRRTARRRSSGRASRRISSSASRACRRGPT